MSSCNTAEGTVSTGSLTFTPANWNVAQTVTVTGVNDFVDDGNIAYTIVTAAATSSDGNYNGFNPADVSVTNLDDGNSAPVISIPGPQGTNRSEERRAGKEGRSRQPPDH